MSMLVKPSWHPTAIATERGWVAPETGELLVALKNLSALIAEADTASAVVTEEVPAVEPIIVDEPANETDATDPEQEPDDLVDATEPEAATGDEPVAADAPKKRGRKPKVSA